MTLESYNQNESNSYYVKAGINYQYVASADVTDIVRDSLGTSESDRTFYAGNIRSTTIPFSDEFIDPNDGIYKVNNSTNRKLKKHTVRYYSHQFKGKTVTGYNPSHHNLQLGVWSSFMTLMIKLPQQTI